MGQAAQGGCGVFIFGDMQNPARNSLKQPALALSKRVGQGDLQRCLPTTAILWMSNCPYQELVSTK